MSKPLSRRRGPSPIPRRTTRARRRLRRLIEGVVSLGIIAAVIFAFSQYVSASPRFQIRRIYVEGAEKLREEQIVAVAGVTTADNVLFFDSDAIASRVMKMPYVADCQVERAYPDMVIIRVAERAPVATLLLNNHAFEIDKEGVVLRELDPLAEPTGPLITGVPALGYIEVGQQLDNPALVQAIAMWQAFARIPLAGQLTLSEIYATSENEITSYFDDVPFAFRWGRGDFYMQALRLQYLWQQLGGAPPCSEYLDLRFENDLVCK